LVDVTLLAYVLGLDGIVRYLTVDGPEEEGAVLFPNGTVERFHQGKWSNLHAYQEERLKSDS
jgi:hypothetical protein